jgi:hypothetical protein
MLASKTQENKLEIIIVEYFRGISECYTKIKHRFHGISARSVEEINIIIEIYSNN